MSTSYAGKQNIILIGILTGLHIQESLMWEALYIAVGVCVFVPELLLTEQCNNFRHTLVMDKLCPLHVIDFGVYALGQAPLPLTEESLEFPLHDAVQL